MIWMTRDDLGVRDRTVAPLRPESRTEPLGAEAPLLEYFS